MEAQLALKSAKSIHSGYLSLCLSLFVCLHVPPPIGFFSVLLSPRNLIGWWTFLFHFQLDPIGCDEMERVMQEADSQSNVLIDYWLNTET